MSSHQVKNSVFMRALRGEAVERTPLWIMRQAGRYLPEYRQIRAQAGDFLSLCQSPALACEVTLQPLRRFELDAAILFSDILTIPDAMGLGLYFETGEGPRFQSRISTAEDVKQLVKPDIASSLGYVFEACSLIRQNMPVDLPLIGFSGSPWTLACYMVEGGSSKDFKNILSFLFSQPESLHRLLQLLADTVSDYLIAQVDAGADLLMIFDSWGGLLPAQAYREFSLSYMADIIKKIKAKHPACPVILFSKGGGQWLGEMANAGPDALGLDWTTDLSSARKQVGHQLALQGNLHPAVLLSNPETIRQQVQQTLEAYGQGSGHIFNLGHGITPDVPPEHVKVLVDAVRELSPAFH